jgi:hypothetical protein
VNSLQIKIYKKIIKGFKSLGEFEFLQMNDKMICLRAKAGYITTFGIVNIRLGEYKLFENGKEMQFEKIVDIKKIEDEKHTAEMAEYRQGKGKAIYKAMLKYSRKAKVRK